MPAWASSVANADIGKRLDTWLAQQLPELKRHRIQKLCETGEVWVNGRRARKGQLLGAGDQVQLSFQAAPLANAALDLDLVLERADLVVVNKPAGLKTAPLNPEETGTLVNALLARYPEMLDIGQQQREAGIIHRLDTFTSGLVIAARHADAFAELSRLLQAGLLEKRYLALVQAGIPASGRVDLPLQADPRDKRRVRVATPGNGYQKAALTEYRVLQNGPNFCLVEASAKRAFRHQIRAHFAALGFPLVNDALYGGVSEARLGERHALHASFVGCAGTAQLAAFAVEAPLADDLAQLLRQ